MAGQPVIVLLVDDDPTMLLAMKRFWGRNPDVEVVTATSAEDALEVLRSRPVDIVIADELMPGMRGVQLLEIVRRQWPSTLRALFTSAPWPEVVIASVNEGGVHKIMVKSESLAKTQGTVAELVRVCLARRKRSKAQVQA